MKSKFLFNVLAAATLFSTQAKALPTPVSLASEPETLPYADKDIACFDGAVADRYIRDFKIDIESFGGRELCQVNSDSKKILSDVYLIEAGKFTTTGSNTFLKNFVAGDKYYSWLKSQTRGMDRKNDVPYASAYNSMGYFSFQDGWASSSTLGRVGTILHEARHTAGFRHRPCTFGPYAGVRLDGCDGTLEEGGSHGVEMEYYARVVVQGTNFHPVYKSMARLMALGRGNFVFNKNPMKKRDALVLIDEAAQQPVLFDNNQLSARSSVALKPSMKLKRMSAGVSLVDGGQAFSIDLYDANFGNIERPDAYSYFKLLPRSDSAQLKLVDIEEFDVASNRYLVGLSSDNVLYTYEFPTGSWSAPIALPMRAVRLVPVAPNGAEGLFVISDDGGVYSFDAVSKRISEQKVANWDAATVALSKYNGNLLTLTTQGEIFQTAPNGNAPELFAPLKDGRYSAMVTAPLYDAFEVQR